MGRYDTSIDLYYSKSKKHLSQNMGANGQMSLLSSIELLSAFTERLPGVTVKKYV